MPHSPTPEQKEFTELKKLLLEIGQMVSDIFIKYHVGNGGQLDIAGIVSAILHHTANYAAICSEHENWIKVWESEYKRAIFFRSASPENRRQKSN